MSSSKTVSIPMKRFLVMKADGPIDPSKIKLEARVGSSSMDPNPIALPIFWAYFMALEEGLLDDGMPSPWDYSTLNPKDKPDRQGKWSSFLHGLITDTSWVNWITDKDELRRRATEAYRSLK